MRRRAAAAELDRLLAADAVATESEDQRRAAFDADLGRAAGLAEEAARREEANLRAAEETRRRNFEAAVRRLEEEEARVQQQEDTRRLAAEVGHLSTVVASRAQSPKPYPLNPKP